MTVHDGEFFSMLGPSGSGKTTVLRLIAGFERASSGTIELDGRDVTATAPFERDVSTVFQDYALFPHLSVLDNVAYGLRVRRVGKRERHARAREMLALMRLEHVEARRPHQLSGGQRQRVALARAIAVRPRVLLLDEPLGALDLKLREQMQVELKQLQRDLGTTFVFVTHDQEEALSLSDRVAVFDQGRIVQVGTPAEIYEHPVSPGVAQFVGTSNLFDAESSRRLFGLEGSHALRPEKIRLTEQPVEDDAEIRLQGVVTESIYLGAAHRVHLRLDDGTPLVVLETTSQSREDRGAKVTACWNRRDLVPLETRTPAEGEMSTQ
nr:ABC transporter ATP-binding protein [Kineosporia rhizophila]